MEGILNPTREMIVPGAKVMVGWQTKYPENRTAVVLENPVEEGGIEWVKVNYDACLTTENVPLETIFAVIIDKEMVNSIFEKKNAVIMEMQATIDKQSDEIDELVNKLEMRDRRIEDQKNRLETANNIIADKSYSIDRHLKTIGHQNAQRESMNVMIEAVENVLRNIRSL